MIRHRPPVEEEKRRKGAEASRGSRTRLLLFPFSPFLLCVEGDGREIRNPKSEIRN
jgi:hypothetical protein